MPGLDMHETEILLDKQGAAGLAVIVENVTRWPITASQIDTTKRYFEAKRLQDQLTQSDDESLCTMVRTFLRQAATSRPHRAQGWFSLKGVEK